eukprot:2099350-Alexandrium_andersonii.AAC.1
MRYAQRGQGARATFYRPELLRSLAKSKLSDWWGLHVQAHIMEQYIQGRSWADNFFVAVLSHPAAFDHPVKLSDRDRGSG